MENSDERELFLSDSDDNDEETDKHAMAETSSDKSGPKIPNQSMKTSDESDQKTSYHACEICDKSFCNKLSLKSHIRYIHKS